MAEDKEKDDLTTGGEETPWHGADLLPPTLGGRLHKAGERLAAAHQTACAWEPALRPVLARMDRWDGADQGRFSRAEVDPDAWPGQQPAGPAFRRGAAGPDPGGPARGRPLPADVRSWLRGVAGPGAERTRVHTDGGADAIARRHAADAVTAGDDVYVRAGRFSLGDPAGRALLAHEARHVATGSGAAPATPGQPPVAGDGGEAAARAGAAGPTAERDPVRAHTDESGAQALERALLAGRLGPGGGPAPAAAAVDRPPSAGLQGWARAGAGGTPGPGRSFPAAPAAPRPPGGPAPAAAASRPPVSRAPVERDHEPQAAPPLDLSALRRDLVADLMRQLRTEFERGG